MSDRFNQDLILGYVEGELDDAQRASFEATLEKDHELRSLVAQLKLDRERLRSLSQIAAPVGLVDQAIQTHERDQLLGNPETPEPLPLIAPASRYKLRRALSYAAVAAVVLISAALVVPTLLPFGLVNHSSSLTKNLAPAPDYTDSDLALADEDAVYDELQPEHDPTRSALAEASTDSLDEDAAAHESVMEMARVEDADIAPTEADPAGRSAEDVTLAGTGEMESANVLAEADAADTLTPDDPADAFSHGGPEVEVAAIDTTDSEGDPADIRVMKQPGAVDGTSGALLARAMRDEAVPVKPAEAKRDPFTGYGNDEAIPAIEQHTQLLVNAASPRIARREIRNWALANGAVVTRYPGSPAPGPRKLDTAPGNTGLRKLDATTTNLTHENAAPRIPGQSQLVIEIKPDQLPVLIDHLNTNPSQHAQLVAVMPIDTPIGDEPDGDTVRVAEAESADAPKALANRHVDTKSHWPAGTPGVSIARGMNGNADQPDGRPPKHRPDDKPGNDESTEEPQYNWSNLLDEIMTRPTPRAARSTDPAITDTTPTPLLQSPPDQPLRLRIIIQQVADE